MELIIYIFYFLFFFGSYFNLKITNFKKVNEIRNKANDYSKNNNEIFISKIKIQFFHLK